MVQLCSRKAGSVIVRVIKNHMYTLYGKKITMTTFWLSSYSLSAPELSINNRKDTSRNK